jgi:hypothetical protein
MACSYRCDACHLEVPPQGGYEPYGWFLLSQRYIETPPPLLTETKHFCSVMCVQQFLARVAIATVAKLDVLAAADVAAPTEVV